MVATMNDVLRSQSLMTLMQIGAVQLMVNTSLVDKPTRLIADNSCSPKIIDRGLSIFREVFDDYLKEVICAIASQGLSIQHKDGRYCIRYSFCCSIGDASCQIIFSKLVKA